MSFFANLFRSFPAWHEMDSKADQSLVNYVKSHGHFRTSHGKAFQEFARKQPMQIQDTLFRLDTLLKQYDEAVAPGDAALGEVRKKLEKLRGLFDDIRQKRKLTEAARDKAKKSEANAERASLRVRALQEADEGYQKAVDAREAAIAQKDHDFQALSRRELEAEQEEKGYKRSVFTTVLDALEAYARLRVQSCEAARPLAAQVMEVGGAFQFFDDSQVGEFRTGIQNLRAEPAD